MNYLDDLNDVQRQGVETTEGPVMVIAGAGSGKTRVLTYRIAHLINRGVDPFNILSLTFTNKAAREMKNRIATIVGDSESRNIWMGTFHSIFARILRFEADRIGYPHNFTIYDTQDSRNAIKAIIKEFKLDDKVYRPAAVHSRISGAKNNLISADDYLDHPELTGSDEASGRREIGRIYKRYSMRCKRSGAMDFDDLLFNTNILFRDHPEVLLKYQNKFHYILVDEYQDTNFAQYLIVKKLAALRENICVVGDDAQSIYAFRGATIRNILNFKNDYPDYKLLKLEQNYRSTKMIVNAANSIIKKNRDQIKKKVWTDNEAGDLIKLVRNYTDNEEGLYVAQTVFEIQNNNKSYYSEFAVLYRTNAQSRALEESMRKLNIPYKIYGGLSFYQRKEIKDLLAYFRLTINHNDEESLLRVINYPARGIGKTTIEKLQVAASENQISIWKIISNVNQFSLNLNAGTRMRINDFVTMIKSYRSMHDNKSAFDLGEHITSSTGILKELYSDKSPEGVSRYDNIQEVLNGLKEYTENNDSEDESKTLSDFLIEVALLTDADQDTDEDREKVTLMTVHASKGLEFPYVFIVGLEENLFPSQMALSSRTDLEEERRLFYVAITRAKKQAFLSYALTRYKWGSLNNCEPSRFIEEIDAKYLDYPTTAKRVSKSNADVLMRKRTAQSPPVNKNLKRVSNLNAASGSGNSLGLKVGMEVEHEKFSKGKVLNIEGDKATVFFPTVGKKQLLLKFAKLTILSKS
ncbi:MAG: ATP-dependent DNA helicase [Bacteroidetes bacterium]|nr:MAG: ATP-dependent DNA helicase [Bacteroidota bacterium]